ncbi:Major Facilitator Superfamily protein [Maioricimonas rarisocia]|uniref:Major Facilitator Superfamily protein n=1 Tax=Maioricimonas rarisocia TaxID=2528026 RepID=A0A517ZFU4_9PLAN|nr:MFS transporter [Maioricimonas rarisocia]QDU41331.1 Major Facilitator Superfamily protein [Maioricimonas rarisocia]
MSSTSTVPQTELPVPPELESDAERVRREGIETHEARNLIVLACHQIVLRVGWIFKTESVIMPAFLDIIAGAGWIRGILPTLNRMGQSLPPLIFADRMRHARVKSRVLMATSISMAIPFLLLSGIWNSLEVKQQPWLPPLFLVLYLIFFSLTGLNQLAFGTVQGKLIQVQHRGRLMGVAGIIGSVAAVTAAWFLLKPWLGLANGEGFTYVFAFNGIAFLIAGLIASTCREPADAYVEVPKRRLRDHVIRAWQVYRGDRTFRQAAHVAMLFITIMFLFPHFQWLGREKLGSSLQDLIYWVVAQNISVGIYSPLLGMVADRRGNRLAVRIAVFATALTPLAAILLASPLVEDGRRWYWLTFVLLGLVPVTMKTLLNYTLELAEETHHPRYLSTMTFCFAIPPLLFSAAFGRLIDLMPYHYPFLMVAGLIALGGLLTFRMAEPRHMSAEASTMVRD